MARPPKHENSHIPETITVISGTYHTKDILNKIKNRASHDLRTKKTNKINIFNGRKYTLEDRIWQSQATIEQLAEKYNIAPIKAQHMRYQARYALQYLRENGIDIQLTDNS